MESFEIYKLLNQREMHEARTLLNRLFICATVNSILLVAFFMAAPTLYFGLMRFVLPALGIAFSLGMIPSLEMGAKASHGLSRALLELEKNSDFVYLKKQAIRPFTDIAGMRPRQMVWNLGYYLSTLFPLCFIIVWGFCLFIN